MKPSKIRNRNGTTMSHELTFKTSMEFAYGVPSPVSPGIVRIVANNPSPLTFKGTNTYLVGSTELMLIDPGPEDPAHLAAILSAAQGRPITHILITHAHRDHVDGLRAVVAETGAKVAGFGRSQLKPQAPDVHPQGHEFIDYVFEPDIRLGDGSTIDGKDWAVEAIHTPGHAPDHLCFALKGRQVLFTGDHIMAWNTTLVAAPEGSMSDYIQSLEKLLMRGETMYLPAHGGRIAEPNRTVKAYLLHRRWREQQILEAIRGGVPDISSIVSVIYPTLDERLVPAASLSVQAHVMHLIDRGLVACDGSPAFDRRLSPA